MSKLENIFIDSNKLDGPKKYKTWDHHMQSTLIYNELWKYICSGGKSPINPIDARQLTKLGIEGWKSNCNFEIYYSYWWNVCTHWKCNWCLECMENLIENIWYSTWIKMGWSPYKAP